MSTHTTTSSTTTTDASTDEDNQDGDDPGAATLAADDAPRSDEIDREVPLSAGWRTVYRAMGVDTEEGGR